MSTGSIEFDVSRIKIKNKHKDIVALEIDQIDEDLIIAAYGDGSVPSLIFRNQETEEFSSVYFYDFDGFKIWAADLSADSLKVCLVR